MMFRKTSRPLRHPIRPSSPPPISTNGASVACQPEKLPASKDNVVPTRLVNLNIRKTPNFSSETRLHDGYQPHRFDVLCTRDRETNTHSGNIRFNICIQMRVDRYLTAITRRNKTEIVMEVIDAVRDSGGRFIRQEESLNSVDQDSDAGDKMMHCSWLDTSVVYYDIGNKKASDKIGHAFRFEMRKRESNTRRKSWPARGSTIIEKRRETASFPPLLTISSQGPAEAANDNIQSLYVMHETMEPQNGEELVYLNSNDAIGKVYHQAWLRTRECGNRRMSWHAGSDLEKVRTNIVVSIPEGFYSMSKGSESLQASGVNETDGEEEGERRADDFFSPPLEALEKTRSIFLGKQDEVNTRQKKQQQHHQRHQQQQQVMVDMSIMKEQDVHHDLLWSDDISSDKESGSVLSEIIITYEGDGMLALTALPHWEPVDDELTWID